MGAKGSSLCDPCRSLCSNKASLDLLNSSSGYTRHGAIPYLQQSSKAGCPLCSMLSDGRFLSSKDPVMTQVYEDPSTFRRNRKVMLKGTRGLSKYSMNKDHDLGGVELWVDIMSPYNDVLLKSAEVIIKYSTKEKAEEHIKNLDLKHHWIKLMTFKADVKRGKIYHGSRFEPPHHPSTVDHTYISQIPHIRLVARERSYYQSRTVNGRGHT